MHISATEFEIPCACDVRVDEHSLAVELEDGRGISVPLDWYPRLAHATAEERGRWRLIGGGMGIHWEDIDEDISVEGLLLGRPSGESQASFSRWMDGRQTNRGQQV
ncbi:MAG: DUF2442 domain-containing protein [Sulfurisoma sp.]|nr:DUF2442 domain-containing protein [Sulfurisoma sp.]